MEQISDIVSEKSDPQKVFELLDTLGQGSYGSVSKALHKETGQLYAVKILPATSGVEIASIKKQIGILKQCNDDHIVRYYGSYFKDNNLWIVMEYCIAGSVTDIMQITKKKLTENQIASILQSALKGLKYLHERKKIHRDIKAANILLDQKGNAKLADFGVSSSAMNTNAKFRTHIGSPYWMSPQIIKYSQYDYKTDIWSLGITAIQLAEGQVPNSHVKPFMAIFQIKSNPVQSLKNPNNWSPQLNDFVRQCLQINQNNRPEARQLLQHPFIKKYSKGQRLIAELVLSSMQEIQQFRMAQSRNSSFVQIIVQQSRECQQTKTLIQNSQKGTSKHSQPQISIQSQLQGSMIYIDSHHSQQNQCVDSGLIIDNINICKNINKNCQNNTLANYINGMKQMCNAQMKCIDMLVNIINSYDQQLRDVVDKLFDQYKKKVQIDIKSLKEMKQKNQTIQFSQEINCKIYQCKNIYEFLFKIQKQNTSKQCKSMQKQIINSLNQIEDHIKISQRQPKTASHTAQKSYNESNNHYESTQDRESIQVEKKYQQIGPIKSFVQMHNFHNISQSDHQKCKKPAHPNCQNFEYLKEKVSQVRNGQSQGSIMGSTNQNRNSSRIMMKIIDQFEVGKVQRVQKQQQLKIMIKDPDILNYLKSKQEFKILQTHYDGINQNKNCNSYQGLNCKKISMDNLLKEQKSTEQSMSKSKNKSVKNLKNIKSKKKVKNYN